MSLKIKCKLRKKQDTKGQKRALTRSPQHLHNVLERSTPHHQIHIWTLALPNERSRYNSILSKRSLSHNTVPNPTDGKQYLHFSSHYPGYCKTSIFSALATRLRRGRMNDHGSIDKLETIKTAVHKRHYPRPVSEHVFYRMRFVTGLDRANILWRKINIWIKRNHHS